MLQVLLFRLGLVISISIWPSIGPLLTGLDTTWPRRLNRFPSRQKLAETMRPVGVESFSMSTSGALTYVDTQVQEGMTIATTAALGQRNRRTLLGRLITSLRMK